VHRSGLGLGAGDLLFVPRSNLSRAETVKRLRYISSAADFSWDYHDLHFTPVKEKK
jgi:hypothetical protein